MSAVTIIFLPKFSEQAIAVAFGRGMTRDEFIFLSGALAALEEKETDENSPHLIREALLAAPRDVLVSVSGILPRALEMIALRDAVQGDAGTEGERR